MLNKKVFILLFVFLLFRISIFSEVNKPMTITIKEAEVRNNPSFLGKVLYKLKYTDRIFVLSEKTGWYNIYYSSHDPEGWIHSSAVIDKKIILNNKANDIDSNVSTEEVVLAGKGFNSKIEKAYKELKELDYYWIDEMEKIEININDALIFIGVN